MLAVGRFTVSTLLAIDIGCNAPVVAERPAVFLDCTDYGLILGESDEIACLDMSIVAYHGDSCNDFAVIDRLEVVGMPQEIAPCVIGYQLSDHEGLYSYTVLSYLGNPYYRDTVFVLAPCLDPTTGLLRNQGSYHHFAFNLRDSIFAYDDYLSCEMSRNGVEVLKIGSAGDVDTVAFLQYASEPEFSCDGTELFVTMLDAGDLSQFPFPRVAVYDIAGDTSYCPLLELGGATYCPYRCDRESPLFLLRYDSLAGTTNVWTMGRDGEATRLTDYSSRLAVLFYQVKSDSLVVTASEGPISGWDTISFVYRLSDTGLDVGATYWDSLASCRAIRGAP